MTVTLDQLNAALPHVLAAPKTDAAVQSLCFRPARNQRSFPDHLTVTRAQGVPNERWLTEPWLRLPDGSPHPGDTIIADLDTSESNLPAGTRLQAGSAILRVSDVFNDGCVKWKARYGTDAKDWITAPGHPALRLRGILCAVEQDGIIRRGDKLTKL